MMQESDEENGHREAARKTRDLIDRIQNGEAA